MKKAVVLFALLLFLVACQQFGGIQTREEGLRENFRTGSQGVTFQFMPNLPPARLYDDQDLDVLLEVANRGAAPVGFANDRIYLSGFDPTIITGISTFGEIIPPLEGKSLFNDQGDQDVVSFKGILRNLGSKNIDKYDTTLLITSCYSYETIASHTVCVDPDPFSITAERKVCTPQSVSSGNQGAPLAISSIAVEPSPGRTRFRIKVSNVGGGTALRAGVDVLSRCNPYDVRGLDFKDVDYVLLDRVEISGVSILNTCRPLDNGHIRLTNGQGEVTCEFRAPRTMPEYATPLMVHLRYGYRQTMQQSLRIIRSD